jgi:Phosphopantetheine attachment site
MRRLSGPASVKARPAASRPGYSAHTQVEGESLMAPGSISEAKTALEAFPGLTDITVIEHGAGQADECLIAYVVSAGSGLDVPELHAYARKALRNGSMPTAIMVVDEIPVTAAGAVNAAALPVPELAGLLPYEPPVTPRQELLCELFAQVLGVARCGTSSDFFDLGGRSVEAMVLAGHISAALGVRVSMADLFKAPTAADMDRRLDLMAATRN